MMIQCKQRLILLGFDTAHQHHCQVVEQQPVVLQMNGEHSVKGPASRMAYDYESQVLRADTRFAKRQIFQYCVVLTVARSLFKGSKRRRPEIVNTVLAPITGGPDSQIHRTVDLAQSCATHALSTKLNDP